MSKRVLCLLAPGFEEIETVTPIDLLRRAGAEVVVASLNGERLSPGEANSLFERTPRWRTSRTRISTFCFSPAGRE